jgi:hypothetical protein
VTRESFGSVEATTVAVGALLGSLPGWLALVPLRSRGEPIRARSMDLMLLGGQLLAAGTVAYERTMPGGWSDWTLRFATAAAFLVSWWAVGVWRLSRAGVEAARRRLVVLGVVVPATFGWGLIGLQPLVSMMILIALAVPVVCGFGASATLGLLLTRWSTTSPAVLRWPDRVVATSALALALLAGGVVGSAVRTGSEDSYIAVARRLQQSMHDDADVPSLRAWLRTGGANNRRPEEWPEALRRLRPGYVSVESATLGVTWGGGFGHWGLVVCADPDVRTPASTQGQYVLPLEPGAWVWHEIQ